MSHQKQLFDACLQTLGPVISTRNNCKTIMVFFLPQNMPLICSSLSFISFIIFSLIVPFFPQNLCVSSDAFQKVFNLTDFLFQRLYRIITSEELVSPHHSAREMMEVVRNRDFTKLFQKSVKKVRKAFCF